MNSYLFNITEIEKKSGDSLYLEFYGGDITDVTSDLLIISAFKSSYYPTMGTILERLYEKYNLYYGGIDSSNLNSIVGGILELPVIGTTYNGKLWVLEIINPLSDIGSRESQVTKSFMALEKAGKKFDNFEIESISIPLFGTGNQGLSLSESTLALMPILKTWAVNSEKLKTVRVFANTMEAASILNRTIDGYFGSDYSNESSTSNHLLSAAVEELKQKVNDFPELIQKEMSDLLSVSSINSVSIKSIAISGRIIAEIVSEKLIEYWYPEKMEENLTLNSMIGIFQFKLMKERSYILSYLRLLQSCGNMTAHNNRNSLNTADASAIVISTIRVAEFISEF
jgi:hypothetical protein